MKKKKVVRGVAIVLLLGLMCFSGYKLYGIFDDYRQAELLKTRMEQYRPSSSQNGDPQDGSHLNPQIAKLQELNDEVVGWITVDDTAIDYPVLQTSNNQYYLNRTIEHEYLVAGSIFMDNRCDPEIEEFNTIIYGHLMRNGSMFSAVRDFRKKDYFDAHTKGTYYTLDHTYKITFFAFLYADSRGQTYDVTFESDEEKQEHLDFIKSEALWYRDIEGVAEGQIITLSTCTSFGAGNSRSVIVGLLECIA